MRILNTIAAGLCKLRDKVRVAQIQYWEGWLWIGILAFLLIVSYCRPFA